MRFTLERKRRAPHINITSLIDVMFLLVIFTLLAAKFEPEGGIAVDLPKGRSASTPRRTSFDLTILHDGTMFLEKKPVTMEHLAERIRSARATMRDPVMVVHADRTLDWEQVVLVTDLATEAGQHKVYFKTRP